jgi:HEAT repeat protein
MLLFSCGLFAASTTVEDILQKMPAQNPSERDELGAALFQLGETDVLKVCEKIGPADEANAAATFAVSALCDWAGQGGMDKERKQLSAILINALKAAKAPHAKAFFIEQLALVGSKTNVAALEPYLADADLCDPASRTMIVLDPAKSEKVLIKNLAGAGDAQKGSIVNALGEIGSTKAVDQLLPLLKTDDAKFKDVVLYALARSGSKKAEPALKKNIENSEGQVQQKAYAYYFDFIEKQSIKTSKAYYREMLSGDHDTHIFNRAISGLYKLDGKNALSDLITAAKRDDAEILACSLRLTAEEGSDVSAAWSDFAQDAAPEKRALIAAAFSDHKDDAAMAFVQASLSDLNQNVRCAAIPAFAKQNGADAFDELFAILKSSREQEVSAAMQAFLSFASDTQLLDRLQNNLSELPPVSQAAVIESFSARKDFTKKDTIFKLAEGESAPVRLAALNALIGMVDANDLDRLIDLFRSAQDESELAPLQDAIVRAANESDPAPATALVSEFKKANGKRKSSLIWILARLNSADALAVVINQASGKSLMRNEALQAFASGPSVTAIPQLIELIRSADDKNVKKMAMQKVIRLTRDGRGISLSDRVEYSKAMMEIAESKQDKFKILGIAPRARTVESLEFIDAYLEDAGLQREAAKAAIEIAVPRDENDSGLSGDKVITILKRAVAVPGDEETVHKAYNYLQKLRAGQEAKDATLNTPPPGYVRLFNGYDLTGWKGLAGKGGNPYEREKLISEHMKAEQARADSVMRAHWRIENGVLVFDGHGSHLCTEKKYRNFEMLVDWKIGPLGDSGIYVRGTPQVQIWDPAKWPEGSGGLYNNQKGASKPPVRADNPIGEWNTFRIKMIDDRVTVFLNDKLVVDNVVLENYWDRAQPIFPAEQIELQSHGSTLYFRNVFIREIFTEEDGWSSLFDGESLSGWTGAVDGYHVESGAIVSKPGSGGNLLTENEYADFEFTFEFKLTPGANSGLGIRAPLKGNAAYDGMELQILDNSAQRYADLKPYQYHASIYGVVPAKRGFQKAVGEWNSQYVYVKGNRVRVELNGVTIVDADVKEASASGTLDGSKHPGLKKKSGHIGFLGHDAHVEFRNIYVREIK